MSTRGTRVALAFVVVLLLLLPKRVDCGYPGGSCGRAGRWRTSCTGFQIEPLGFYVIELAANRDIGFAYSTGEDCR